MAMTLTGCSMPVGSLDSAAPGASGTLMVKGWTFDPDDPTRALDVVISVDGNLVGMGKADQSRMDVAAVYPEAGPNHGFAISVPASPGAHIVCAGFLDATGDQQGLACGAGVAAGSDPVGAFESVSDTGGGFIRFVGWAADPDTSAPIIIRINENFETMHSAWANVYRPDVGAAGGLGPYHGFDVVVPLNVGTHRICVYADNVGGGSNRQISCTDVYRGPTGYDGDIVTASPATNQSGVRTISTYNTFAATPVNAHIVARGNWIDAAATTTPWVTVAPSGGPAKPSQTIIVAPVPKGWTWTCLVVSGGGITNVSDCQFVNV